ncbi:PGF-CTERM sorting domain-containing protein [Halorhabdus sp. CBA1104]|uniref:PGF-CTERM sorting domain-containing protein n=1 Tax=Halorhabdus sp. CBA1104 TaxID=1380432 RepID=UPI0012B30B87|nr:PGF-CTERM sorting domain-containing protein [Halorhabdus sp. CBA1104]QGN06765.1 PGF-CTERM sorting domain-containing protein [Halorhabdus sp. CBA1104]
MSRLQRAVLIVVLLGLVGSSTVGAIGIAERGEPIANETSGAQDAYVADDGDVVLVFEENDSTPGNGHLGMNVEKGLAYGIYEWAAVESNVTGSMTMAANRSRLNGSGTISAPRPDALEELDVDVQSRQTEDVAKSDATVDATIALPDDSKMLAAIFSQAQTSGEIYTSGTRLSTAGTANLSMMLPGTSSTSVDYRLRATEDGHVLEVARESHVTGRNADRWATRERAADRLRRQFESISSMDGTSSAVSLDTYAFERTNDGATLELAYTVEIEGLNEMLQQAVTDGLATQTGGADQSFGPTTDAISDSLANVSIDRAVVTADLGSSGGNVSWNLTVDNYDGLARAYFTAMEASVEGNVSDRIDNFRSQLDAMAAAEFSRTLSWNSTVESTDEGTIELDLDAKTRTTNWETLVTERQDHDLPPIGTQRFSLQMAATDDRIDGNGSFWVQQANLYNRTMESYQQSVAQSTTAPVEWLGDLEAAGFKGARLDASVNRSGAVLEGGMAFENLSAITSQVADRTGNGTIERAYVEQADNGTTAYLRMANAVDSESNESAVRQLEMVSEETTVHSSDEWDQESASFPTMDAQSVRSYVPNAAASESGDLPLPLLGGGAGVAVLAAGAVVYVWRR